MKRYLAIAAILIMTVSLTACGAETKETQQDVGQNQNEVQTPKKAQKLKVYYADENAEMQMKQVEITELTSGNVWTELQKANPVLAEVRVIECEVNEEEKRIDLNLSSEFGEYLMETGTAGETCAVTAVVNTYLDAFTCEEIKILDNGETLVSNHTEYEDYLQKR